MIFVAVAQLLVVRPPRFMKAQSKTCIAWIHNKDGIYELGVVHSRDLTDSDYEQGFRRRLEANQCPSPFPVVFLDERLSHDSALCSYLAAKARKLLASPPFSDPAAL